jgi:ferredoxin
MTVSALTFLAIAEDQTIEVKAETCKREWFRQSNCQLCSEICPEHAITFMSGPNINGDCSSCGLCINICPTETFQYNWDMPQYFHDQMQHIYKASGRQADDCLEVHCQQAQAGSEQSLVINCLGNINENLILASALIGFKGLELSSGHCEQCHLAAGKALCESAMQKARALIAAVKKDPFLLQLNERQKGSNTEEKLSRRSFFTRIKKNIRQKTLPADYVKQHPLHELLKSASTEQTSNTKNIDKHRSEKRDTLIRILKEHNLNQTNKTLHLSHWKKMQVEQEKCVACAICVNVCPTGALTKEIKDNKLYRYYSSATCNNCGVCEEACPHKIIHFVEHYKLDDIIEEQVQLVAQVELTSCFICGETIPVSEGKICTTCEKRQLSPVFLN